MGWCQTSIGTGYDLENSIFSPDGRNFQVEYAMKAVENGGTSVGIRCKNGVVLAVEKVVVSKLLKPNANKRIATIDRHLGAVRFVSFLSFILFFPHSRCHPETSVPIPHVPILLHALFLIQEIDQAGKIN